MGALRDIRRKLSRYVGRLTGSGTEPWQLQVEDLLYRAGRTSAMEDLLVVLPQQICNAFQLEAFHLLLREGSQYAPREKGEGNGQVAETDAPASAEIVFAASCSMIAHLKREAAPVPVKRTEPDAWYLLSTPEELESLRSLNAQWLLPLHGRTGLVGFATLARLPGRSSQEAAWSRKDLRSLRNLGSQVGMGLETAQFQRSLQLEAARRARADRELELAREVQERLLPQRMPTVAGLDVAAAYRSAEQVGGDYYDAFATPDGSICYAIADVSGKGTPAALLMATLRASLRVLMLGGRSVPEVLSELNRQLYAASSSSRYATFAMLVYDPATGDVTSCNAGHNAPLLLRGGDVRRLECGGPVLGLLPEASFDQEVVHLQPGDSLAMYTDGVTEAETTAEVEWTEEGLLAALARCSSLPAAECVARVLREVEAFTAGAAQRDDLTLMVLRRTGTEPTRVPA